MNNFFISAEPPVARKKLSLANIRNQGLKVVNKGLDLFKTGCHLVPMPNPMVDMTTVEQRINYYHLLDGVITNEIPGDVVELGCFTGECALLFQHVIQMHESEKMLHLYDSFETKFTVEGNIENILNNNFKRHDLTLPVIHKGFFQETIPQQLPERICFVHIDCGFGGDHSLHKDVMLYCLQSVYPRMSKGAVCVLMDYHDKSTGDTGYDVNPGVKLACDEFLASKPEKIVSLYGNQCSHGFFRKVGDL